MMKGKNILSVEIFLSTLYFILQGALINSNAEAVHARIFSPIPVLDPSQLVLSLISFKSNDIESFSIMSKQSNEK